MRGFAKISLANFEWNETSKISFNFNPRILEMDNSISLYQFAVQIFRTRYINLNIQLRKFIQDPREESPRDTPYIRVRPDVVCSRREERKRRKMRIAEMDRWAWSFGVLCPRYSGVSKRRIAMGRRRGEGKGREGKGPDFCTRRIEI